MTKYLKHNFLYYLSICIIVRIYYSLCSHIIINHDNFFTWESGDTYSWLLRRSTGPMTVGPTKV